MTLATSALSFDQVHSDADFIIFSAEEGVISEHFTPSEAAMAYYAIASEKRIGEKLPAIYRREEKQWVPIQ